MGTGINGDVDVGSDSRWRIAIYGDMESAEHAKTRILIYIDKLVRGGPILLEALQN